MSKQSSLVFIILGYFFSGKVFSGTADLELSMSFDVPRYVQFGDVGLFSMTLKNNGPDVAGSSSPSSFPILVKSSILASNEKFGGAKIGFSQQPISQDCLFLVSIGEPLPGELPIFRFDFYYPVIPVGTSITCYGKYIVNIEYGQETITWSLNNSTDLDPDESNNTVDMAFEIQPPMVPLMTIRSFAILLMLISLLALYKLKLENGKGR